MKRTMILMASTVVLVVCFGSVGWRMLRQNANGQIMTELSDRSKEFIDREQEKSSSEWNQVEFSTPGPQAGDQGSRFSTACFTISFPFLTKDQKIEQTSSSCTLATRVLSPPARLVIWARPLRTRLDEDTAITLRRLKKDMYSESVLQTKSHGPVIMFSAVDELSLFFSSKNSLYSFAFTDTIAAKLQEADLQAMLDSFTITIPSSK